MSETAVLERTRVGRKKGERRTTMVRIYEEFAEAVKQASSERRLTIAEFCNQFLLPCADKAHRDYIKAEAKRLGSSDTGKGA